MRVRLAAAVPLIALAAWFAACDGGDAGPIENADGGADVASDLDDVDAAEAAAGGGSADLLLLAMSDWRGQLEPLLEADTSGVPQRYGGLEGLAAIFDAERAAAKATTLLVTTGGAFGATPPLASASGDLPVVLGLNLLGATADTFGAHDFDRGRVALGTLIEKARFKAVSTNLAHIRDELGPKPVTPMYMADVDQGRGPVKVAILGLTSTDLQTLEPKASLGTIEVRAPLASEANRAAKNARMLGADVVLALASVGATGIDANGAAIGPLAELAGGLEGVDVLVGGMTDRPVAYTTQAGVLVVQTRNRGRSYARVRLHVEHGGALVTDASLVDAQVARITGALCDAGPEGGLCACGASAPCPPDAQCSDASALCEKPLFPEQPAAAAILDAAGVALQNLRDTLLAKASASFSVAGADAHETAMGDLVADALLARYKEAGAQIALVQGSRLRAGLPSPYDSPALAEQHLQRDPTSKPIDLVFGDAYAALPGGDAAVVRKLTGSTLHLALEHAVAAPGPAFLQVAGIKLSYATSADAGSRLRSLALDDGTPIPNDATPFTVVLSDRISAGEDGYGMLSEEPAAATPSRDLLVDVLADYLHSKPTVSPPASFERILAVP